MWWRRIRPKHTPESVAAELVRGLEDGSIVLREEDLELPEDPVARTVADAVRAAVFAVVTENRRDAKGLAETVATVAAAAERAAARVLGGAAG